jgi:hypothetical protein
MVRRNPAARLARARSRTQHRVLLVIVFHEVGFADYISRPPATLKRTESTTRVLPMLTVALPLLRLQPDRWRASATGQAGLRNRHLCDPAPGEGE